MTGSDQEIPPRVSPQRARIVSRLSGPVTTLASIALVELLEPTGLRVPSPNLLHLLTIVYSSFAGGTASGLVSASLALLHAAISLSLPGEVLSYSAENLRRMVLLLLAEPAAALLVGALKRKAERVAGEAARDEALRKAHDLLQRIPGIAWSADAEDLRMRLVSRGAEDLLGYPVRRWLEEPGFLAGIVHPEDLQRVLAAFESAARSGRDHELQYRVIAADGREVWLRDLVRMDRNDQGPAVRLHGLMVDITAQRQAQDALRESEERYRLAAMAVTEVIWDRDLTTGTVWRSGGIRTLFGYHPEEVVPDCSWWYDRIHPEDRDRVVEWFEAFARSGSSFWSDEYRFRKADGTYAHVLDRGYVMCDREGRPARIIGATLDVTAVRTASDRLRTSERRLREAEKIGRMGSWEWDARSDRVAWSDEMYRIHGLDPATTEVSFGAMAGQVHPEDRARVNDHVRRALEQRAPFACEHRIVRADGGVRTLSARAEVVLDPEGRPSGMIGAAQDVTEQRAAVEELRRTTEELQAVVQASPLAIVTLDREARVTLWSPAAEELFGWTAEEVMGKTPPIIPPEHQDEFRAMVRAEIEGERLAAAELPRLRRDGSRVDVMIWTAPLRGADGRIAATVGFLADVTERKRAARELAEHRVLLETVLRQAADAIVACDAGGRITFANDAARRMAGLDPRGTSLEAAAEVWGQALGPDGGPIPLERWSLPRALRGRITVGRESRMVRSDGGVYEILISAAPLRAEDGEILGAVATFADLTQRKKAERALRESESQFRAVFDGALDAMIILDDDFTIRDANPAACDLMGVPHERLVGRSARDFAEPGRAREADRSFGALRARGQMRGQYRIRTEAGSARDIDCSARANVLPGRHLTILRDVTQSLKLQDQLRQSQKMEAIGRLAGGVAHDFNNLLTAILGSTDILLDLIPESGSLRQEALDIRRASLRASALTGQLLAFSRRQVLKERVVSLEAVVAGMERMLRRLIGEDVHLATQRDPGTSWVRADPGQIEQVILNLAVNARDAMPTGGRLTIRTSSVRIAGSPSGWGAALAAGDYVVLEVSDTGCGMDEQTLARIFEPFFTLKGPGIGTGLGLATAYGIVRQSGGDIAVASQPGRGTTFRVCLPRVEPPALTEHEAVHAPGALVGSETILLVEDEEMVRALARRALAAKGYHVLVASDGEEAMRLAADHAGRIDLLLTDVVMPGLNGAHLAAHLAATRPELKTLYMSGYFGGPAGDDRPPGRADDLLQKPFTPEILARRVRQTLDRAVDPPASGGGPARARPRRRGRKGRGAIR